MYRRWAAGLDPDYRPTLTDLWLLDREARQARHAAQQKIAVPIVMRR